MSSEILPIINSGDLILDFRQHDAADVFSYRVDTQKLQSASKYFDKLLNGSFSEASEVRTKHDALRARYGNMTDVPAAELPRISVIDIGRISKVATIQNLTADFLRLLHHQDLSQPIPPVANIANLAIVADRFDAEETFSSYIQRKRLPQAIDGKTRSKDFNEERARQKVLIGYLAHRGAWVTKYSKQLILAGSKLWSGVEQEPDPTAALWWDLPYGIEDELQFRREKILDTLDSILDYFVDLYSSGERQCKLGYDSSLACDSFQLGEMARFLRKADVGRLKSLINSYDHDAYAGDIERLLETLRKCPNYQIDSNHAHCGLRTRLIPILDRLQFWLEKDTGSPDLGICVDCFRYRRPDYSWLEAKPPLLWRIESVPPRSRILKDFGSECSHRQFGVREMFTAVERRWT